MLVTPATVFFLIPHEKHRGRRLRPILGRRHKARLPRAASKALGKEERAGGGGEEGRERERELEGYFDPTGRPHSDGAAW